MTHDSSNFDVSIFHDFDLVEDDWRKFEIEADSYAFQSYDWLKCWYDSIGAKADVKPQIVIVRDDKKQIFLLLPLAIETRGRVECLIWMGGRTADYHAPLVWKDFSKTGYTEYFGNLWADIKKVFVGYDVIHFEKQPRLIGKQDNPMIGPQCEACDKSFEIEVSGDWKELRSQIQTILLRREVPEEPSMC